MIEDIYVKIVSGNNSWIKLPKMYPRIELPVVDDDDDDDDNDDDELFCGMVNRRKVFSFIFPDGTIVRDPHHCESSTLRKQDLNLCRT